LDNAGTLKITDNQFIFTGITNRINDVANIKTYLNGVLFDDTDLPIDYTSPPTDNTFDYIRNSADSITFTNATALIPSAPGVTTTTATGPLGARLSIDNGILSVIVVTNISGTVDQSGIPASYSARLEGIMHFKR
jgi:hypothetical protein